MSDGFQESMARFVAAVNEFIARIKEIGEILRKSFGFDDAVFPDYIFQHNREHRTSFQRFKKSYPEYLNASRPYAIKRKTPKHLPYLKRAY